MHAAADLPAPRVMKHACIHQGPAIGNHIAAAVTAAAADARDFPLLPQATVAALSCPLACTYLPTCPSLLQDHRGPRALD